VAFEDRPYCIKWKIPPRNIGLDADLPEHMATVYKSTTSNATENRSKD
jgi:hypothetical protein